LELLYRINLYNRLPYLFIQLLGVEKKISKDLSGQLLTNPTVQFMLAMFIVVVLWGIDAFDSFTEAIYAALTTSFSFLPIIVIFGALAYLKSR